MEVIDATLIIIIISSVFGSFIALLTNITLEWYKSRRVLRSQVADRMQRTQFEVYRDLWKSLDTLKNTADALWEEPNVSNLKTFADQLKDSERMVNQERVIIERYHFEELKRLFKVFKEYLFGKEEYLHSVDEEFARNVVEENQENKDRYEELLKEVEQFVRERLRSPVLL